MKLNTVKFFLAIALALIFGFLCEIIAPEVDGRNWISLAVASVSVFAGLLPAMGLTYSDEKRGVSIKLIAYLLSIVLVASNIIFSCFEYKIEAYIVVTILLSLVGWTAIYGTYSLKRSE